MKKNILIISLLSIYSFLHVSGPGIQLYSAETEDEPYAPVFSLPDDTDRAEIYIHQQERVQSMIPSKAEVKIPPYPGAVVFLVHTTDELKQMTGKDGLAEIRLIAGDPLDEIVKFYQEHLPGWNYDENFSVFWYGEGDITISQLMGGMPHISIREASPTVQELAPDATYLIGIVYETDK